MARRRNREKTEILVRVASRRTFLLAASTLAALFLFLGSPAQIVKPQERAVGGVSLSTAEQIAAAVGDSGEDRGLYYSVHRVVSGDTVGDIAESYGVSQDSIISFNDIQNTRALRPGQLLKVPSMAGILYTAKEGDTAETVAASFEIDPNGIIEVNGLLKSEIPADKIVFLPDARLPSFKLREINGDLFRWPVRGWITDRFGWRKDPFSGSRTFHTGLDISAAMRTPVAAGMEGRVVDAGYSSILGNYVVLAHHSSWSSTYGHMDSSSVKVGEWVRAGQRIGYVGNTGYTTGPHLHFSVLKNGRLVNPSAVVH